MPVRSTQENPTHPANFSFDELRHLIDSHMAEAGVDKLGLGSMVAKAVFVLGAWALIYTGLLAFGPQSLPVAIVGILLLVVATLGVELGIMHDASHRAIFHGTLPNKLLGMTLTLAGGSSILWYQQHVIRHHSYTNMPGKDPDIDSDGVFRFRDGDPWRPWHRWQHIYALPLYALIALRWVWVDDFRHTLKNTFSLKPKSRFALVGELILSRVSHITLFFVIPYYVVGSFLPVLVFYLIHWMLFGVSMAVIFQLAHVTDVQVFPEARNKSGDDWAIHQLATTANFAVKNRFLTHLIGGLNYQVEHHIFNRFSHLHYPKIQPIVKKYCEEHGAPYFEYPTVMSAVKAHFGHLRRLAQRPINGEAIPSAPAA